ncbi:MAG: metallophosphoesterase [Xanthomonadaceae bacterium]|nr:metallophosphoesterase [Xanthomonadaceae bacterium]
MFRLAHFSDPHLHFDAPPPTLAERFSKRSLSRLSWARGRRELQRPELLAAAVADVRAHAPDHWLISGDITNFSLPGEFVAAAAWLATLGDADDVSVVPGNHDALVPLPPAQGWVHWRPWMHGDDGVAAFPFLRQRGELALIGLSTAVPTAPGMASGRLGRAQLDALAALLADLGARGLARVVALHHPPADGVVKRRKALEDRAALCAVVAAHGAELLLHGHSRDARFDPVPGPDGLVPVLGVPSISAIPNPKDEGARWNLLGFERIDGRWTIEVTARRWNPAAQAFVAAGGYRLR